MQTASNSPDARPQLYIFGWPSHLGGADTKLVHILMLLSPHYTITVIPNHTKLLNDKTWTKFLNKHAVSYSPIEKLPNKLNGVALSLSNQCFFTSRLAHRAKEKGLRIVWSSEMMWHHEGEIEAIKQGIVDRVLYVSDLQKSVLIAGYGLLSSAMTGNYIDPALFPFVERRNPVFTIGRLSRPDPLKYPEDFPVFYESLELPEARFRVMAWDDKLARKYKWHIFDKRWNLLRSEAEPQAQFLQTLDLFVYPLGHNFVESWGRSTVEAMLTGAIPLVQPGHNFSNLLVHGESGFICADINEFKECSKNLFYDLKKRRKISRQCHEHAVTQLCDKAQHFELWKTALTF